jgi:hypothetical protein
MLTESTYLLGLYLYLGAAGTLVLYTAWWSWRSWRPFWAALAVLIMAALLLTPAYPGPGVATLAPALIVAGFQLMTEGPEAAQHAIKPLLFMLAVGSTIALLLQALVFRKRGQARRGEKTKVQPDR